MFETTRVRLDWLDPLLFNLVISSILYIIFIHIRHPIPLVLDLWRVIG